MKFANVVLATLRPDRVYVMFKIRKDAVQWQPCAQARCRRKTKQNPLR